MTADTGEPDVFDERAAPAPGIDHERRITLTASSALDPNVDAVIWIVRRLVAVNCRHSSDASVDAARAAFRLLNEQLHLPGLNTMTIQVSHDPGRTERVDVFLGIGVFGPAARRRSRCLSWSTLN